MIDPLHAFVFAGLFSPGPNVVMLTASGARFGFVRTLPHLLGVVLGVGILAAAAALGLTELLEDAPRLKGLLRGASAGWILWLAWRMFRTTRMARAEDRGRPFGFLEAILFQWVNPKVWAVALAAAAGFPGGGGPAEEALRLGATFSGLNVFVCAFWTVFGRSLTRFLARPARWRAFMTAMAALLAASGVLVLV